MRPTALRKREKIKQDRDAGHSYAEIARRRKVSKGTIHNILHEQEDPAITAARAACGLPLPVQNFTSASQTNTHDDPPVQALAAILRANPDHIKTFKIAMEMFTQAIEVAGQQNT